MKVLIAVAVVAMTLCSVSVSVGQGQDMGLPTGGICNNCPSVPSVGRLGDFGPSRADLSISRPPGSREPRVLTNGPLAPSDQDRADHAAFLSKSNTGLIRLLPQQFAKQPFNQNPLVKINGGGAYYSFTYLSHEYGYGSDLELGGAVIFSGGVEKPDRALSVGFAGADFGMLTNLGETLLETLTVGDSRAAFMRAYKPPRAASEARSEYRRFQAGVTINGARYQSKLPIQVGATYLLRSIAYQTSDVLVAFRIVREDPDQSLIIAWKLLKQFTTPTLNKSK